MMDGCPVARGRESCLSSSLLRVFEALQAWTDFQLADAKGKKAMNTEPISQDSSQRVSEPETSSAKPQRMCFPLFIRPDPCSGKQHQGKDNSSNLQEGED